MFGKVKLGVGAEAVGPLPIAVTLKIILPIRVIII